MNGIRMAVGQLTRAAGGAFNDVDERQIELGQMLDHIFKQRLRIGVVHIVGGRNWRQPDGGAPAANRVHDAARDFKQQPGTVAHRAAVVVGALVAAGF